MVKERYEIGIIQSDEDWRALKEVRRQVVMVEKGESEDECFDGNDFCGAIHIAAKRDGAVVGGMRLRILSMADGGTMAWEKLAILSEARGSATLFHMLTDFANQVTETKGCRRVIGAVADPRGIAFWKRRGFHATGESAEVHAGLEHIPIHRFRPVPLPRRVPIHETSDNEARRLSAVTVQPESVNADHPLPLGGDRRTPRRIARFPAYQPSGEAAHT